MFIFLSLTCFWSAFRHIMWVCITGKCVAVISALTLSSCPWHCGGEDQRPLVVVLEAVRFRHTVVHVKVCGQRNLWGLRCLVSSAPRHSLLALTWWLSAPFWVGPGLWARIWEGSEAGNVRPPFGADVWWMGRVRARWKGFLKHSGAKRCVACFAVEWRSLLVGSKVRWPCCTELSFCCHAAGRVVWQVYVGTWGIGGDSLAVTGQVGAFSVLRLRENKIIWAVPLWAAGLCDVPWGAVLPAVSSTVSGILVLALPALRSGWTLSFSRCVRRVFWSLSTREKKQVRKS